MGKLPEQKAKLLPNMHIFKYGAVSNNDKICTKQYISFIFYKHIFR